VALQYLFGDGSFSDFSGTNPGTDARFFLRCGQNLLLCIQHMRGGNPDQTYNFKTGATYGQR